MVGRGDAGSAGGERSALGGEGAAGGEGNGCAVRGGAA